MDVSGWTVLKLVAATVVFVQLACRASRSYLGDPVITVYSVVDLG